MQMNTYGGDPSINEDDHGDRFDLVPWTVFVKSAVNDTELPGYKVDYQSREISFCWRDAYTCFFREAEYMDNAVLRRVSALDILEQNQRTCTCELSSYRTDDSVHR